MDCIQKIAKESIFLRRIFIILGCMLCILLFSGCDNEKGQYTQMDINLALAENEDAMTVYADEREIIYIVRERINQEIVGKTDINHSRIVVYDYVANEIRQELQVNDYKVNAVSCVTPYQNGIIYINYAYAEDEIPGAKQWKIKYYDGRKTHLLKEGKTLDSFATVPMLAAVGDTPIIAYQLSENGGSTFVIEKVLNSKLIKIWKSCEYMQTNDYIQTNGKEYCIMTHKEGNDYASLVVGNESKVEFVYDLENVINSFAITKEHIVCSLGDFGQGKLLTMSIESKEKKEEEVILQFFRFAGSDDNCVLCVDSAFTPYLINAKTCTAEMINIPKSIGEARRPVGFFHIKGRKYMAWFYTHDEQKFYGLST